MECRLCKRDRPASEFVTAKGKPSSACAGCRKAKQRQHIKNYYRRLPPDKRHTLTHRRRAEAYGVEHKEYSRTAILERWRYACCYCGDLAKHLDHVHPLSKGGADAEHNIVPACEGCNLSKGAKTLAEWAMVPARVGGTDYPF